MITIEALVWNRICQAMGFRVLAENGAAHMLSLLESRRKELKGLSIPSHVTSLPIFPLNFPGFSRLFEMHHSRLRKGYARKIIIIAENGLYIDRHGRS